MLEFPDEVVDVEELVAVPEWLLPPDVVPLPLEVVLVTGAELENAMSEASSFDPAVPLSPAPPPPCHVDMDELSSDDGTAFHPFCLTSG